MNTLSDKPSASYVIDDVRSAKERMRHFSFILFGQIISVFGSTLTSFSLGVWAFQKSHSVSAYTSIFFAVTFGAVLMSPFAGALVDRWNKKYVLILGTMISAGVSAVIAILLLLDLLNIWMMVICAAINGIATAFSQPAINASIKVLIDPEDLGKVNGMMASGFGLVTLVSPIAAGYLIIHIDLLGILLIDLATFVFGLLVLSFLKLPNYTRSASEPILVGLRFAVHYIKSRPALVFLVVFFFTINLAAAMVLALIQPLILTFTDPSGLGNILAICGLGYLAGAILMGVWGGPKRKIYAVYASALFVAIGLFVLPMTSNVMLFGFGAFLLAFGLPIGKASNQTIIQRKVSGEYIGRVDGFGKLIIGLSMPIGFLCAGPIAEYVFEPFMAEPHAANEFLVGYYGTGLGRGIALMLSLIAVFLVLVVCLAISIPQLRRIEIDLEDEA